MAVIMMRYFTDVTGRDFSPAPVVFTRASCSPAPSLPPAPAPQAQKMYLPFGLFRRRRRESLPSRGDGCASGV